MLLTFLGIRGQVTAGDVIVGGGTLILALVTVWLGFQTRDSAKAAQASAAAAFQSIEIERAGVEAMTTSAEAARAQVDAIDVPFVLPIPDPQWDGRPIHRWRLSNGQTYVRLRLLNIGSGPAVVGGAQFTAPENVELLEPMAQVPIAPDVSEPVSLLTRNTWAPNPSQLRFYVDYTAPDGRGYRTRGKTQLDGDGESITCLTFERITEEEWEAGV
jgi:hypothetical protein